MSTTPRTVGHALGAPIAIASAAERRYPLLHRGAVIAVATRVQRGVWSATLSATGALVVGASLAEVAEVSATAAYLARAEA